MSLAFLYSQPAHKGDSKHTLCDVTRSKFSSKTYQIEDNGDHSIVILMFLQPSHQAPVSCNSAAVESEDSPERSTSSNYSLIESVLVFCPRKRMSINHALASLHPYVKFKEVRPVWNLSNASEFFAYKNPQQKVIPSSKASLYSYPSLLSASVN